MKVRQAMDLFELRDLMGEVATIEEARAMRAVLMVADVLWTENLDEDHWWELVDRALDLAASMQ